MAKEIGVKLKITSEGGEKVVRNLADLETELQTLQNTLKTQDFGSEAFKETANNIQRLKSQIEDVDKAVEGLGTEKRFQAISSAVGVATGSFQAFSGVVGLVASDTQTLEQVQRAEAQALQVLNVALGINTALLELSNASKLKDIIVTKAQTIATKVAAGAQRLWNLALAANPIGLVITAIATLTAAIIYFTKETEKSVDTIDELNIASEETTKIIGNANKARDEEIKKIAPLLSLLENENTSRSERVKLIKQIQKDYPGYLKNANLEKTSLEDIKKANDDLVKSILKVAQSRAAANELAEIYAAELQQQVRLENIRVNIEKELQEFVKLDPSPAQLEGKRKSLEGYLLLAQDQIDKENETLAIRKKVALSFLDETQAVNDLTDGYKDNTKEVEKNEDAVVKASNERIKRISAEIKAIEKLANVELEYRADILEAQRKVLEEQDAYLKSRTDALTTESERVLSEINDIFFKTIPSSEQVEKLSDGYRDFFEVIDKAIRSGDYDITQDGALGLNNLLNFAEKELPGIGERLKNVGEKDLQSLIEYFGTLKETIKQLRPELDIQVGPGVYAFQIPDEVIDSYRTLEEEFVKIQNAQLAAGLTNEQLQKALTGAAL